MDLLHKRPARLYRYFFGTAEFNEARFELRIDGSPVAIERRPLVLLAKILEHADEVVTKGELLHTVWGGRITVENVLANAMAKLRKALGVNALLLVTIPRVGYRIKGPVKKMEAQADCDIIPTQPYVGAGAAIGDPLFTSARIAPPAPSFHHLDVIPLNPAGFDRAGMILDAGTAMNTTHAGARAFHHTGGATLEAWAGQRHLDIMPIEQRLNLFMSLAREVSEQHSRGTVHAFLQPDNLIVADNGRIRITAPEKSLANPGQPHKTSCCCFYRAPETYRNDDVTPRSDIYSLGILLYQLLTSDFSRPLLPDWRQDITNRSLQHIIEAATHSCPSLRPESVEEFIKPLYTHRIGHHQKPEIWTATSASMLRQ
ncbi:protein kinase domain-containing protein [Halopseudomonas bauzanensis]|uniref:DNA-binding winged helix-turn-helix (WHTH) domain-containing protein n=1 Tax=Halopseudomonas bauzanensis TaxID=653930 RepID=A0A1H9UTZ7_9GAMM|nr:winged helix-turn-helix domain-containing protein [Halopseudomonas bauzanensis]SES12624.1 non-specific serine/threonine protein kinase [Halopseudomonas bauzanensis]SFM11688.1 DNA-binding winged helix-turn-helix (wHTH) domain-containing protein [Halopseudomonas bauzanensis]